MTVVSIPKVANIGIGAKAITTKPNEVDKAVPKSANPVVRAVSNKAVFLSRLFFSSWRKRSVKWMEKSIPTPIDIAAIVAVIMLRW